METESPTGCSKSCVCCAPKKPFDAKEYAKNWYKKNQDTLKEYNKNRQKERYADESTKERIKLMNVKRYYKAKGVELPEKWKKVIIS